MQISTINTILKTPPSNTNPCKAVNVRYNLTGTYIYILYNTYKICNTFSEGVKIN